MPNNANLINSLNLKDTRAALVLARNCRNAVYPEFVAKVDSDIKALEAREAELLLSRKTRVIRKTR